MSRVDTDSDSLLAYEHAMLVMLALRTVWEDQGSPTEAIGGSTGRAVVPHPFLREMREQEKICQSLRADLKKKHRGPEPSAVIRAPVATVRR